MNVRQQDGVKLPFLCPSCEALFNDWETLFAKEYFHLATEGTLPSGQYGNWLSKFCASVVWRVGTWGLENGIVSEKGDAFHLKLDEALQTWKKFLLGELQNPSVNELHLLPIGEFSQFDRPNLPPNWNRYTRRYVETDFVSNDSDTFMAVFVKMGPVAVFGHVENDFQKWIGSRVAVNLGNFVTNVKLPDEVLDYAIGRAAGANDLLDDLSPNQKKVIDKTLLSDPRKFVESEQFKEMNKDIELTGKSAFRKK